MTERRSIQARRSALAKEIRSSRYIDGLRFAAKLMPRPQGLPVDAGIALHRDYGMREVDPECEAWPTRTMRKVQELIEMDRAIDA